MATSKIVMRYDCMRRRLIAADLSRSCQLFVRQNNNICLEHFSNLPPVTKCWKVKIMFSVVAHCWLIPMFHQCTHCSSIAHTKYSENRNNWNACFKADHHIFIKLHTFWAYSNFHISRRFSLHGGERKLSWGNWSWGSGGLYTAATTKRYVNVILWRWQWCSSSL